MTEKIISAARIRKVWCNPDLTVHEAAAQVGLTRGNLWRRARRLDLPTHNEVRRGFSMSDLRRMWADPKLTNAQIATAIGRTERNLGYIARKAGLPPRALGPKVPWSKARFAQLYLAGVSLGELAGLFDRNRYTLGYHVGRLGLPGRGAGWQPTVTLDDVLQAELGARMAEARQAELLALAAQKEAA